MKKNISKIDQATAATLDAQIRQQNNTYESQIARLRDTIVSQAEDIQQQKSTQLIWIERATEAERSRQDAVKLQNDALFNLQQLRNAMEKILKVTDAEDLAYEEQLDLINEIILGVL